ncbi:MAG: hypothetical protein HRU31_15465 [Rhodobacteraceae bacterium]|nr:hypothetical protein [Paracoccaceae bacterium]
MRALRDPDQVMRLHRLGAAHATRLSFLRVLLRGLQEGGWQADRPLWEVDGKGVGRAVYRVQGQGQCYSLVCFAHDLPDDQRSDRVIAEAWDTTFALVDGEASAADLTRLEANVPLQEAGRVSDRELILSRANRSVRLWEHVVEALSQGAQPDPARLDEVGYLMRTTAVYGSGKFGAADHATLAGRSLMDGPFRAEMLTVWLIRAFVADLVDHIAAARNPTRAVRLNADSRNSLGIGNATGLGMAPFLVNHPLLLNAWITARETALAQVLSLSDASPEKVDIFASVTAEARAQIEGWIPSQPEQQQTQDLLRRDATRLTRHLAAFDWSQRNPWAALWHWAEDSLSIHGQEWLISLLLEPHGDVVDALAAQMGADEISPMRIDGQMSCGALLDHLRAGYGWALGPDYTRPDQCAQFWYVSQAKLEPRLGLRHEEPGAELEQPLDVGRDVAALAVRLENAPADRRVADFLQDHPAQRRAVRRVQMTRTAAYAELRDNLIGDDMTPIDMLRCKLAFFGATRFDPRSDRWVRITLFQGAPYPEALIPAEPLRESLRA